MQGRLGKTVRHPQMKVMVDFNEVGYTQLNQWVDITDEVLDISGSKEKSGKSLGSVTSDIATFTVDNTKKLFSKDNINSPYYGKIKSNLKFRLLTGFQGETLVPYASGFIEAFTPSWKDKKILIKTTDYFKLFKGTDVPTESYQDISWDALVNILCDHVGLPSFIVRNIPKTEFYYNYFKFEEENCFEALKSLMEVAVGEAYFEQEQFYVKTKLALDYQLDTTVDHDITVDDLFDFEENVDGQNIINSLTISSDYKTIAPLEVVFETPENVVKVENEQHTYDGSNHVYVDTNNLPLINNDENPIALKNITQGRTIYINGIDINTGRITIHPDSLANVVTGDILTVSYSYQQLALLAGKTRKFTCSLNGEVDSLNALDIVVWDKDGNQQRTYTEIPDTPNTVSKQTLTFDQKNNTVTLTLKNNYADPITISTLQFRGYPIKVISPIEVFVRDLPSQEEFGKKEHTIQNNYINNIRLAEKVGQYIVDNNKVDRKRVNIEIAGYSEFSLDDISKVTEMSSGTNHKFTNERIDYTFNTDSGWNVKASLLELDSAPWVYESFKGESWEKTNSGAPDSDFLKDISANLIKNGGAELYSGNADLKDTGAVGGEHIVPDYWQFTRRTGDATARVRDGGNLVLHGLRSFEITTSNSGSGYFQQMVSGIKGSQTYILSFVTALTACSGKATLHQYTDGTLVKTDSIDFSSDGTVELVTSSLATTNAILVEIEKKSGTTGPESLVFDKVKLENSRERTIYIENEETNAVQVGQRYANSVVIGNNYGIEVLDDQENTRIILGQYEPDKYGLVVYGGSIKIVGGLPSNQVNVGPDSTFEDGYDPSAKVEFYYGDNEPTDKNVIWVDTSGENDVWKRWDATTSSWKEGATGQNAITGVLSNDSHVIPTDKDGNNGVFTGAASTMYIYVGSTDDSANWNVTVALTNVAGTLSGKTFTASGLSADTGYVDFTAARSGYPSITKRFTLTKSKQGATGSTGGTGSAGQNATAYWLVPSVAVIQKNTTNVFTPASISIDMRSQTGTSAPAFYGGRLVIAELAADGTTWTDKYGITSPTNETASKSYTPSVNTIKAVRVRMYQAGVTPNGTTNMIDEQIIPVVSDGETGAAGANAIMAVLSNETHSIPTDKDGNNGNYNGAATTMSIYNGTTDDSANWTVAVSGTPSNVTGTLSGKTYTVTALSADTGYVDLIASRTGYASITKRFTLAKNKQGSTGATGSTGSAGQNATAYWLVNSVPAIQKNISGVYTPATITVTGKSQTGTGSPVNYSGRFIISESTDGTSFTAKYTSSANEATKTHTPTAGIKAIKVQFYLAGGTSTLLDEQIIPIVSDGATGTQGIQGPKGADGSSLFTWVKYATDANGSNMSDTPDGKTYIGLAYNKTTSTESSTASDYTWSLIQGPAGSQGPAGTTTYTWVKYADDANGTNMSDSPTGKRFLGLAYNKTTSTESATASDYSWSPLYDNVVVGGVNLALDTDYYASVTNASTSAISKTFTVPEEYYDYITGKTLTYSMIIYANGTKVNIGTDSLAGRFGGHASAIWTLADGTTSQTTYPLNMTGTFVTKATGERYSVTEKIGAPATGATLKQFNVNVQINAKPQSTTDTWYISKPKLEIGNVATDWTAAPQDTKSYVDDQLSELTTKYSSEIENTEKAITLEVDRKVTNLDGSLREFVASTITQTEENVELKFTEMKTVTDGHAGELQTIQSYFDFSSSGLNIGKTDSPLNINISNSQMDFMNAGKIVAYINGQKMYIDSLEVLTNLIVGNHKIEKYNTNITLIKWVGG
ncbi:tail fiber protein [Microcystis phage MaeS]|nr:tail fiber protein [Microcystis phage MaeS]